MSPSNIYKTKVSAFVILVLFILMSLFSWYISNKILKMVEQSVGNEAKHLAYALSQIIEQDIESYENLVETLDSNSDYYLKMHKLFNDIKNSTGADYIYTVKMISDTEYMYILDGEEFDSENYSPIALVEEAYEETVLADKSKKPYSTKAVNYEKWGMVITGYAPIFNHETGKYHGMASVDFSYENYSKQIKKLQTEMLTFALFICLCVLLLIISLMSRFVNPLITDYLTKQTSKRHFDYILKKHIEASKLLVKPLSVLVIDMDNFKTINDKYGHVIGDTVIIKTAEAISHTLRDTDCLGRYGGDEFVASLYGSNAEQALQVAKRIVAAVNGKEIQVNGEIIKSTVSIGVYEYDKNNDANIADIIKKADEALYIAKEQKNMAVLYSVKEKM